MKNKRNILTAIFILALVSAACAWNTPATPDPAVETMVQATYQALTASASSPTMTPQPAATFAPLPFTMQPTLEPASGSVSGSETGTGSGSGSASGSGSGSTSNLTSEPTSDVKNSNAYQIYFANDATSTSVAGGVNPGHTVTYSLYVIGNQPAQISLESQSNDLTIGIYDPGKKELLSPALKPKNWQGYFQKAGIYFIKVYGGAEISKFNLSISISARVKLTAENTYVRLKNRTVGGRTISYVVNAGKDKTMDVRLNTAPDVAAFTIRGFFDGQIYAQADDGTVSFSMLVPENQDYIIDVISQNGKAVNYTLFISLR